MQRFCLEVCLLATVSKAKIAGIHEAQILTHQAEIPKSSSFIVETK
jgi:hypothetical protein